MSYSDSDTMEKGTLVLDYVKGLIVSMVMSFGLVLAFAFSLKWIDLNENMIVPVNLAIKMISVVIGSLIAVKGDSKGLIKGVLFGLVYMIIAFLSFSCLSGSFALDLSFLLDLICSGVAGGIIGIIKVNKKN